MSAWEILSENGQYRWILQNDGNAVVYRVSDGKVISAMGMDTDPMPGPPPTPPGPAPWETVTTEQLKRWRGAIGTTLWDGPLGYRPGQPDNAIFTAEYINPGYSDADRAKMLSLYPYSHVALNPILAKGYHGLWPDTDYRGNIGEYQRLVDGLWHAGKIPVLFLLDDTGVYSNGEWIDRDKIEAELTPLYSQPWFQQRSRIVVNGWEHNYCAADWQWVCEWMARVFPNALRYVHFQSGHGAPGWGSELAPTGPYANEGAMWWPIAPYIHGFLQQDTYSFMGETDDGRTPDEQVLYDAWDFIRRFQTGEPGNWPTAGADGTPISMVMFEYGAYLLTPGVGPGRFGTFPAAAEGSVEMGRQLLDVEGIGGYGDGGPV